MNPLTAARAFDLPDHLAPKADPALIAADEQHFAAIAESLEQTIADLSDRIDAARKQPGGSGQEAMDRDFEVHRLTARLRGLRRFGLDLCLGHIVARGRPRARVHRPARPHRQRRSPAAARLALPRRRAVLRRDPREPDGAHEPPPLPLDRRPDHRLLGRGVHRGRLRGPRRPRRPVRVHRQPRQQPVAPDARRARHHPGRPGRDHPGRVARHARRGRRSGHGQDRGRAAPHGVPPLLRPAARATAAAACCSSGRTSPTWRTSATSSPASARRACRPAPLRDLVPEGAAAAVESDPEVARLKSTAAMVSAIEPAVRLYEETPTTGMEVETPWGDLWLSPHDWAEAFAAPDPDTPHNEARDQIWDELVAILVDKHDDDEVPPDLLRRALRAERGAGRRRSTRRGRCSTPPRSSRTCGRCPPTCGCAPRGSSPRRCRRCGARTRARGRCRTCRCWTPPGGGSATRRRRAAGAGTRRRSPPSGSGCRTSSTTSSRPTTPRCW